MANINGKIQTDVIILDDTYDVSVAIPTSKPIVDVNAYTLTIYNEAEVALTPTTENVAMLAHVAASYNAGSTETFPDNFYLELSPPASILPNIKDSTDPKKTTFAIKNIAIQFATGAYVDAKQIPGSVKGTKA
jgi:hypothetical protein